MDNLIGPSEVAKLLGVTRRWATELLRTGQIKGQKVGGNLWITTLDAVEDYKRKKQDLSED